MPERGRERRISDYRIGPEGFSLDVVTALDRLEALSFSRRLWAHDPTLWSRRPEDAASVRRRCGWLDLPARPEAVLQEILGLAAEVRREGFSRVLVLGMGGSSLFPLVASRIAARTGAAGLALEVLDSVLPAAVAAARESLGDPAVLVLVSSKSGGTVETRALASLAELAGAAGTRLVAITDPGSDLERHARERGWRAVISTPPDVGGRFSALTAFGLLPALLAGLDPEALLGSAAEMLARCGPDTPAAESPGAVLGAALACRATRGGDTVRLASRGYLEAMTPWIEQLVAESTGKHGLGIWPLPAGAEPVCPPGECLLVRAGDPSTPAAATPPAAADQPTLSWISEGPEALGAELVRWEVATAAAAALLEINPFDEPDVGLAKGLASAALDRLAVEGALPWPKPRCAAGAMTIRGPAVSATSPARAVAAHLRHAVRERRLVSLLAWVPPSPEHELQLLRIRDDLEHGLGRPVALGIGPRYLHATGQLHKGGSDRAVHLLLTCAATPEIPMPDRPGVRFGDLAHAQALADVQALSERGRPVLHLHVEASPTEALEALEELLSAAAPTPGDRRA